MFVEPRCLGARGSPNMVKHGRDQREHEVAAGGCKEAHIATGKSRVHGVILISW